MQRILVIDDEENMRHMLSALLGKAGFKVTLANDGKQGIHIESNAEFDCILCDIKMPAMNGLDFLMALRQQGNSVPVVMMSAFGTIELAVEAMKNGASDFITKPFQGEEVIIALEKAIKQYELQLENKMLRRQLQDISKRRSFDDFIGNSESLQRVIGQAKKVASHKTTVLITGESGTGKELVAQGIHYASTRKQGPFVAVNCGSIPENLLESEFFGVVKGAFTGADSDRKGLFTEARGGTLFLDEIGELPLHMQVKLLRVLQEEEIRPLGSAQNTKVDVRIIAATARDLPAAIQKGTFREDLYFRLNVVNIHIPPLRERPGDIPVLCDHFIKKHARHLGIDIQGIAPAALDVLLKHPWPGNVRELENTIERAIILADRALIMPENLPQQIGGTQQSGNLIENLGSLSIKQGRRILEKQLIAKALKTTGGNKSRAAELLEISYPALLHKIKEYLE